MESRASILVRVTYDGLNAQTTFVVTGSTVGYHPCIWYCSYDLQIGEQTYSVMYNITNGKLMGMSVDIPQKYWLLQSILLEMDS